MKNIQVIDGALNSTFSIFQATDEEFALLFPEAGQDIQYAEDLPHLADQPAVEAALSRIWQRPIRKRDAMGIHGTLFYELQRYKKWCPEKREDSVDASAINAAQENCSGEIDAREPAGLLMARARRRVRASPRARSR
jgi:hypothetical protein